MKSPDKYKTLYDALVALEESDSKFTLSDLAISTSYQKGTLGVYIRNRLKNKYLFTIDGITYTANGIKKLSYKEFHEIMSQSLTRGGKHEIESRLQDKAFECFALAIEVYNKPLVTYRIEAFLILMINAWELLLKAIIVRTSGELSIFYPGTTKAISISEAADRAISSDDCAIRNNLAILIELRDKAVHLVIPAIQGTLSRVFQASVVNFLT